MHGSHVTTHGSLCTAICSLVLLSPIAATADDEPSAAPAEAGEQSPLAVRIDPERTTTVKASVKITGTLLTPSSDGNRSWKLASNGTFEFGQRQLASELSGPLALNAIRRYTQAGTTTVVGGDHTTQAQLPRAQSVIHVRGSDRGLLAAPASQRLTRRQHDLLQMPCDPLPCSALLPTRDVEIGDKWNCDAWVLPRLTGLDAVTKQSLTCTLTARTPAQATVGFEGAAEGAVSGSASSATLNGRLILDLQQQMISELTCDITEKRSAGPVSPGLDASIRMDWTQAVSTNSDIPTTTDERLFEKDFRLSTPWRLTLSHSAEWHVFNQTPVVMMMRQIRDGALISQCNISATAVVPPGQHTSDADFRNDIMRAIQPRAGTVESEKTIRDDNRWRIRQLRTRHINSDVEIVQDYYLCTAAAGVQFSLMFSHTVADEAAFGDEATRWLNGLGLSRRRPALPFR